MKDVENAPHEGKRRVFINFHNFRMKIIGIFIKFIIKDHDLFMNFFIKKKKFQKNYTIIVYKKNGLMQI